VVTRPVAAKRETTVYCDDQPCKYVSVAWLLYEELEDRE